MGALTWDLLAKWFVPLSVLAGWAWLAFDRYIRRAERRNPPTLQMQLDDMQRSSDHTEREAARLLTERTSYVDHRFEEMQRQVVALETRIAGFHEDASDYAGEQQKRIGAVELTLAEIKGRIAFLERGRRS